MTATNRMPLALLAGVVLLLGGVNGALWVDHRDQADHRADRVSATQFVESALPKVMSYQPDNVGTYRSTALTLTAPPFKAELSNLLTPAFIADAKNRKVSVRTTVQAAGVTSQTGDHVTFLVYINQWRTTAASKAPAVDSSRLKVTVERTGDQWRVAGLGAL